MDDVYEFDVNSSVGRPLKGLYVEIQYRTLVQHASATTIEVIGFITESQPKFKQGDTRYEAVMKMASELLARAHEEMKGPLPELDDRDLVPNFPCRREGVERRPGVHPFSQGGIEPADC